MQKGVFTAPAADPECEIDEDQRTRRPAEQVGVDHEQVLVQVEHDVGNAMAWKRVEVWERSDADVGPESQHVDSGTVMAVGPRFVSRIRRAPGDRPVVWKDERGHDGPGDRRRHDGAPSANQAPLDQDHDAERGSQNDAVESPRQHQHAGRHARGDRPRRPPGFFFARAIEGDQNQQHQGGRQRMAHLFGRREDQPGRRRQQQQGDVRRAATEAAPQPGVRQKNLNARENRVDQPRGAGDDTDGQHGGPTGKRVAKPLPVFDHRLGNVEGLGIGRRRQGHTPGRKVLRVKQIRHAVVDVREPFEYEIAGHGGQHDNPCRHGNRQDAIPRPSGGCVPGQCDAGIQPPGHARGDRFRKRECHQNEVEQRHQRDAPRQGDFAEESRDAFGGDCQRETGKREHQQRSWDGRPGHDRRSQRVPNTPGQRCHDHGLRQKDPGAPRTPGCDRSPWHVVLVGRIRPHIDELKCGGMSDEGEQAEAKRQRQGGRTPLNHGSISWMEMVPN